MPTIDSLALCVTARNLDYSGTRSPLHLSVTVGGEDVYWARAATTIPEDISPYDSGDERPTIPFFPGQSLLWPEEVRAGDFPPAAFDSDLLGPGSVRLGIAGADMLDLLHVAVWGLAGGRVWPLAMLLESAEASLSTEWDEGRPSMPIPVVGRGDAATPFTRVFCVYGTDPGPASGTGARVALGVPQGAAANRHTFHALPDAYGFERRKGEVNTFLTPRFSPPERRGDWQGRGLRLRIGGPGLSGDDFWLPSLFVAFGIREANGAPAEAVPLAFEPTWGLSGLSTDPSEGQTVVDIPLAAL